MNCAECRDYLVAYAEGLLGREETLRCEAHLESCTPCRAEHRAITSLQQRLIAQGQIAAAVALVKPVMRRVLQEQDEPERDTLMSRLFTRWGFGMGAAAGATAIVLILLLATPREGANAAEILAKGAQAAAKLRSIHLRGQLRTAPQDNFAAIMPALDFVTIELWKQYEPQLKWRIDKPGRIAVMDGESTLLFIKPGNVAMKVPRPTPSAFDTQWLHEMANLSETLTHELTAIKAHGWPVTLSQRQGADGKPKSVITVEAKSGLPDSDYVKNKFFMTADTRRVYVFDDATELLESVQIHLRAAAGDQLIFEVNQIEYNQPIDAGVFHLELPANVSWYQEPQVLPDNAKYAAMTADQAARAFFESCAREDWNEAQKFVRRTIDESMKQSLGGLEVVSLGQSFGSQGYPGRFIPYEIKLKSGGVKKHNLAIRNDNPAKRWVVDGGL